MAILEVGRVCRKTKGDDAGKIGVILTKPEKNTVTIAGPNIKKTKVSISQLEPTPTILRIAKDTNQEQINEMLKKEGLFL